MIHEPSLNLKQLAEEAGLALGTVRELIDAGVLPPAPANAKCPFDADAPESVLHQTSNSKVG